MAETKIEEIKASMLAVDEPKELKLKFKSCEGEIVETSVKCAKLSILIRDMLEMLGENGISSEVQLEKISTKTLKFVIEWMERNQDRRQPTSEQIKTKIQHEIDPWDKKFIDKDTTDIFDIITASDFLNIPGLLWLSTRQIAVLITGKEPHEMREILDIDNDFDEEILDQAIADTQLCDPNR